MSSSGGIWALRVKKTPTALPVVTTERPFPDPDVAAVGETGMEWARRSERWLRKQWIHTHTCC